MYDKSSINILYPGMMGGCVLKKGQHMAGGKDDLS